MLLNSLPWRIVTMSLNILNKSVWGASGKIADDEKLKASNICYISIILDNKKLPHRCT